MAPRRAAAGVQGMGGDMLSLFKEIGATWRSIAAVILAYGLIALLFFYNEDALSTLFGIAKGGYDQGYHLAGEFSKRAEFLFGFTITPGAVFVTMMILFVRVVVLSLVLWIAKGIIKLIFGSGERQTSRY
jgi:hypothetical protein